MSPPRSVLELVAAAEQAQQRDQHPEALELLAAAAAEMEVPSAELCVKIARGHTRMGSPQAAFSWLSRVVDATDSFKAWSAASVALARLVRSERPATRRQSRVAVSGSYTTSQLCAMLPLAALREGIDLVVQEGLYGQYEQDLLDPASAVYGFSPDQIILAVDESALRLPNFSSSPEADIGAEVGRWTRLWERAREHSSAHVIQHNFALRPELPFGHLSLALPGARHAMVSDLNRQLAQAAGAGVSIVDCDRLASTVGKDRWFDDSYWFRAKQAVALEAVPLLARHTVSVLASSIGLARKCLVLDLDNTLWGGVVGEDGIEGIQLGADGAGEAFVAFQEYVLALKDRGVLLAVASKNNDDEARSVFERHPEMRIKLDDISVFAANWDDKPTNLRRIAQTLGLGLDALVLVDDNPAERQIVRRTLPEVDVIALSTEPAEYRKALSQYTGFEPTSITAEDRQRTSQYRARAAAATLATNATDMESFYRDLQMKAIVAPFDELHLPRITQLFGKTNQFNLTTHRYGASELKEFMVGEAYVSLYLKLIDRFTDHGLVAVALGVVSGDVLEIDSLLMSCRVIGRTVEAQMLMHLCQRAGQAGCHKLRGTYVPTGRNHVVSDLYERFGFTLLESGDAGQTRWEYDLSEQAPITNEFIHEIEP